VIPWRIVTYRHRQYRARFIVCRRQKRNFAIVNVLATTRCRRLRSATLRKCERTAPCDDRTATTNLQRMRSAGIRDQRGHRDTDTSCRLCDGRENMWVILLGFSSDTSMSPEIVAAIFPWSLRTPFAMQWLSGTTVGLNSDCCVVFYDMSASRGVRRFVRPCCQPSGARTRFANLLRYLEEAPLGMNASLRII
jgi:hypothetical protein